MFQETLDRLIVFLLVRSTHLKNCVSNCYGVESAVLDQALDAEMEDVLRAECHEEQ
jgi:hypothetical protein